MSGMHVLSDILKGGNKLEKTSTLKEKEFSDSPESAVAVFAAVLSGCMNSNVDSKGQNSKDGQESEEMQSTQNPVPNVKNLNEQESILGYGNFAFSNLFQPMLQGDLPAGKEANSGNDVSQGPGGLTTAYASLANEPIVSDNLQLALLNLVSLASDEVSAQSGMTTSKPQGTNPTITELDKYKQVITDLLIVLSGEITDPSLKGNLLGLEGAGTMDIRQEMAKIVQGWMTVTDDVAEDGQATGGQATESAKLPKALQEGGATGVQDPRKDLGKIVGGWMTVTDDVTKNVSVSATQKRIQPLLDILSAGIASGNSVLNAKLATLLTALNPVLNQEIKDAQSPQGLNGTLDVKGGIIDPAAKGSSESIIKSLQGTDVDLIAKQVKDTASLINVQQKSDGIVHQENRTSSNVQGAPREEVQKGESMQSTETSGVKDVQNQSSGIGIGAASNILVANVAGGKTIAIPVWEQISNIFREQVTNRHQELKELDIQLHPADLGKIQIGMRWENGQVHLVVHASEAATGQLLQNQLSDLRQNLTNQGVNCGMLQMGQGGERQQNPHGDASQRTIKQSSDLNEDEDLIPVTNPLSLGQDEINRINVTA